MGSLMEKVKKNPVVARLYSRESFGQFLRYLTVGGISFCTEYGLFNLLTLAWAEELRPVIANIPAMMAGFLISFTLNRFWSFRSKTGLLRQLGLYSVLFLINLGLSSLLLHLLSEELTLSPRLAKLFIMGAVVLWNFILYRKIIYK